MDDNKIYELIDRKNNEICERFESNIKTLAEFIALENQGIKKSIDGLTDEVKKQNGRVDDLELWQAECSGRNGAIKDSERKSLSNWQITGIMAGCIISIMAVLGFVKSLNNDKELTEKLYWKADRLPDSTIRGIHITPITEDTAFIKNSISQLKNY